MNLCKKINFKTLFVHKHILFNFLIYETVFHGGLKKSTAKKLLKKGRL